MKRIFALILAGAISLCFCSCNNEKSINTKETATEIVENDDSFDEYESNTIDSRHNAKASSFDYDFLEKNSINGIYYGNDENDFVTRRVGDFLVTDFEDGICIKQYLGENEKLVIPEMIENKKVLLLSKCKVEGEEGDFSFPRLSVNNNITSLSLPKYLRYIEYNAIWDIYTLENIYVSDENPYFKSDEGILYNKNKTIVLFVPEENQKIELTFDDSVSEFASGALRRAKNVKTIKISKYFKPMLAGESTPIDAGDFPYMLENFIVSEDNQDYSSENGVLFNKDKTKLIAYPYGKRGLEYAVSENIVDVQNGAFDGVQYLNTITLLKNVKKFDEQFSNGYCEGGGPHYFGGTSIKTVKGYKGTVAESFAKENNLEFVPLD